MRCAIPFAVAAGALAPALSWGFDFSPGYFYGTNSYYQPLDVVQYSPEGTQLDFITIADPLAWDLRGLTFDSGGLLHVVVNREQGFAILAIDESGAVQQEYYMHGVPISGSAFYGKIAFTPSGEFYVGTGYGLARFTAGDPNSGTFVWQSGAVNDVEPLPSGNLLIANDYYIYEITSAGVFVRSFDPSAIDLVDVRGIEYDPATDSVFATMLGYSGYNFQLMKLHGSTGELVGRTTFWYGDDLFLADDGRLVVGSLAVSPGIFSRDLQQLGYFTGPERGFVTQMPVPEPTTLAVISIGILALLKRPKP